MTTKLKVILGVVAVVVVFFGGFFAHAYRTSDRIAGYEKREQEREAAKALNDAEQNKLRGENNVLREGIAKKTMDDQAKAIIIENRGGVIAAEAKNLELINENLKHNQAVINAPTDLCVRCREFSKGAVERGQISKPLPCKNECPGNNQ